MESLFKHARTVAAGIVMLVCLSGCATLPKMIKDNAGPRVTVVRFLITSEGGVTVKAPKDVSVSPAAPGASGALTLRLKGRTVAYRVSMPGPLYVAVSGRGALPRGQLDIDATAGEPMTVALLSSLAQPVRSHGVVDLGMTGDRTHLDFDTDRQTAGEPGSDVFYDLGFMSWQFTAINGAELAEWEGEGKPGLADCAAMRQDAWHEGGSSFSPAEAYCFVTSEGRLALFTTDPPAAEYDGYTEAYVVWQT